MVGVWVKIRICILNAVDKGWRVDHRRARNDILMSLYGMSLDRFSWLVNIVKGLRMRKSVPVLFFRTRVRG